MNENVLTISGNVATAPELRSTNGGVPVANFRVASSSRYRNADGVWVDQEPNYYNVSAFRSLGLNAVASLAVGQPVLLRGRLRLNAFVRKDGTTGLAAEIEAYEIGHNLCLGTAEFTRAPALRQVNPHDRLADPAIQSAFHGEDALDPGTGDLEPYDVVDQVTGEVREAVDPTADPEVAGVG